MTKAEIAAVFEEIADLLDLKGENPFRVRAYRNAARIVDGLAEDLDRVIAENRLTAIKGIGEDLASKIIELHTTGRLKFHEELRASMPAGLLEMLRVPGFGPKRAKVVYEKLGVDSLEKLEAACRAGRVAALPGFGEKSQQNILKGIELARQFSSRHHLHKARAVADPIVEALRAHPGVIRCSVAGSLRRCRETIGDVDFLVSAKPADAAAIIEEFTRQPGILTVTARGETKASVVLRGGLQADLRVVRDDQFAFALNYFTGSKEHNIAMRARALRLKNWSLNEYGFSPAEEKEKSAKELGSIVPCRTEEEIYRALGLDYIPPELREDMGELAAAEAGQLPRLVELKDLRGTFHNHTRWSDGLESIEAMAQAALDLGLEYIGIADHSASERQANGLDAKRVRQQAEEVRRLNEKFAREDFRIFFGTECDILADGALDFDDETLALFDYVVASVHQGFSQDAAKMTKRICRALEHPLVTMLGHPTGRLLLEREPYAVDLEAVIETAAKHHKIIELNAHPYRLDLDWRWWKRARDKGVRCAINPDAHSIPDLQFLALGVGIARKGWLTKRDVVNCLSAREVEQLFHGIRTRKAR
ncbi:MAG: DNA polymerase/3'-5' exonuclease PolX [Verrucomicrobiae bacterium]|nr:DNA polymerase/3'-5' exonuclease PolX [Verrucomicrobiae bacterium]MCX7915177.1 DNA polymerase/3'-5' exonuclease PolX [Verrucomicrobiae bacterium]MDW8343494.1 DNA polymerase/3'-5' exonuclease PolX [Verrucomicrobiae bacterium]